MCLGVHVCVCVCVCVYVLLSPCVSVFESVYVCEFVRLCMGASCAWMCVSMSFCVCTPVWNVRVYIVTSFNSFCLFHLSTILLDVSQMHTMFLSLQELSTHVFFIVVQSMLR